MDATFIALKVEKLGYYEFRGEPIPGTPGPVECFSLMRDWARARGHVSNTSTIQFDHGGKAVGFYFADYDVSADGKDHLLVMWRESASDNGKFYGLPRSASLGGGNAMSITEVDIKTHIPGFPSYFWYNDEHKLLFNISFAHSQYAKKHFVEYVKAFLKKYTEYSIEEENEQGDLEVTRCEITVKDSEDNESQKVIYPKVSVSNLKVEALEAFFKDNINDITAVRREEDASYYEENHPETLILYVQNMFKDFVSPQRARDMTKMSRKMVFEMDWKPDEDELVNLIKVASDVIETEPSLKDLKVKIRDEGFKSVRDVNSKYEHEVDLQRADGEYIAAKDFLAEILNNKKELLEKAQS